MYEKKNPLQTFTDPLKMHNMASTSTDAHGAALAGEKAGLEHVRIMPDNWPLSPHIHGL